MNKIHSLIILFESTFSYFYIHSISHFHLYSWYSCSAYNIHVFLMTKKHDLSLEHSSTFRHFCRALIISFVLAYSNVPNSKRSSVLASTYEFLENLLQNIHEFK